MEDGGWWKESGVRVQGSEVALTLTLTPTNQVVKKVLHIDSILLTTHYSLLTAYHRYISLFWKEFAANKRKNVAGERITDVVRREQVRGVALAW